VRYGAVLVESVHRFLHDVNNSVQGLGKSRLRDTFKCRIRSVHANWFIWYWAKCWRDCIAVKHWQFVERVYMRNIQVSCSYCTLSFVYILFCKSRGDYRADLSKVVIKQGRTVKMVCMKEVFMFIEGPRAHTHTYTGIHASTDTH